MLHTLHRKDDPITSRQAAQSVEPHLTEIQAQVLHLIKLAGAKGLTDEELSRQYGTFGSTARTRRAELAKRGLVVESKQKRRLQSGLEGRVWVSTDHAEGYEPCLL